MLRAVLGAEQLAGLPAVADVVTPAVGCVGATPVASGVGAGVEVIGVGGCCAKDREMR